MGTEKQLARRAFKRRKNNQGSISQRKNGTFQVAIVVGKKPDGTPRRIYRPAKTEAEANQVLAELIYKHGRGELSTTEPVTFDQLARS